MNEWGILTFVAVGGAGTLAFLKIVCDEIVVKYRALELRVEVEEERAEARAREKAAQAEDEAADGTGVQAA